MPAPPPPLFASEATAARLLDMQRAQFRSLVEAGALPKGQEIAPGVIRWRVADLDAILTGKAMSEDFQW